MRVVRGSPNPLHFRLPARLRKARKAAGLSCKALVGRVGAGQTTVGEIEAGNRLPSVGMVARLAAALGVSAAWLAFGIGEQSGEGTAQSTDGMAHRLASARIDRGHSKASLADATRPSGAKPRAAEGTSALSPGAILGIERGGQAGVDTIGTLARVLRVSPAWLAFGIGPRELPPRRRARSAA